MSESNSKRKTKAAGAGKATGPEDADDNSITGQAAEVLSKATGMTKDLGRRTADAVGEQYARVSRGTQDAYEAAVTTGVAWEEDLERYVRRNPITSLLVTAGVSLLLGFMLGRETVKPPARPWWRQWG